MRCVKLFVALVYCAGFLNASTFTVELDDQTGLGPAFVPKVYAAFTAADQNYDTCFYLSGLPGDESRFVVNQNFRHLALFLWMFEANNIHDAPFEAGMKVLAQHFIGPNDLINIRGIKVVASMVELERDSYYSLSVFTEEPPSNTLSSMAIDPKSLPSSQEVLSQN